MNNQEIQPEVTPQAETAEQSEMSDLDYARQEAQQEVDAFLSNAEFDSAVKLDVINGKIAQVSGRIDKLRDEMDTELDGAREQFKSFQSAGYDQAWLDRTSDEIKQRYTGWQAEDRAKVDILTAASLTLTPNPSTEPESEVPEIVEPSAAEEPAEVNETPVIEPLETESKEETTEQNQSKVEKEKPKIDTAEILKKIKRNQELAEDLRSMSARIRNVTEVSPREPWFRPLQRFDDEFVGKLNNRLLRIIDGSTQLRNISQAMENGDSNADSRMIELTDELNHEWRIVASILEDANHFMNRLRWQTEELSNKDMDRDHPVFQVGSQLRRATEELNSRRNGL